ncbi:angiopoietin-related protein 7-like [Hydractinia symbiolongicarpus]|uniref:angiopoietin-related protein 7-like n=1 Tax=Hydractinia symbiolongicarpus TaxID=13093 RepID=UPI00254D8B79|nr:angiopoietin-related protein 7-like [Hydractinia symbiolongicarpus]
MSQSSIVTVIDSLLSSNKIRNATDAMSYLNGMKFSTLDRDNDENTSINCVTTFPGLGGWWNNQCTQVVLTGRYYGKGETSPTNGGIHWIPVTGSGESLKYAEIKLLIKK